MLRYAFHTDESEEVWDEGPVTIPSALYPEVLFGQRWFEVVIFFLTLFVHWSIGVNHGLREKTKFVD